MKVALMKELLPSSLKSREVEKRFKKLGLEAVPFDAFYLEADIVVVDKSDADLQKYKRDAIARGIGMVDKEWMLKSLGGNELLPLEDFPIPLSAVNDKAIPPPPETLHAIERIFQCRFIQGRNRHITEPLEELLEFHLAAGPTARSKQNKQLVSFEFKSQ